MLQYVDESVGKAARGRRSDFLQDDIFQSQHPDSKEEQRLRENEVAIQKVGASSLHSRGRKGIRFNGSMFDGLITATSTIEFGANVSTLTLSFNLTQWA